MTAPTTSAEPRFVCPECGDTRIGEWRRVLECRDVEAWHPNGTPAKHGATLDRLDDGHDTENERYTCFCGANFDEPKRVEVAS